MIVSSRRSVLGVEVECGVRRWGHVLRPVLRAHRVGRIGSVANGVSRRAHDAWHAGRLVHHGLLESQLSSSSNTARQKGDEQEDDDPDDPEPLKPETNFKPS